MTDTRKVSGAGLESARPTLSDAESAVRVLLRWVGEDPSRSGLVDTPGRVARAWREMCSGYAEDPEVILGRTFEESGSYSSIVLVRSITFESLCEHHALPIVGVAHVGYIPSGGRVAGLSKVARAVEALSRRMQTQERLTSEITAVIMRSLSARGAAVLVTADHACMSLRGVRRPESRTVTVCYAGELDDSARRREFHTLLESR